MKKMAMESTMESRMNTKQDDRNLVDLKKVFADCMGEKALLEELVTLFKNNITEFVGNTQKHIEEKNIKAIGFTSHKIKSSLKMMRVEELFRIAEQMDATCKDDGDLKHLEFLFNQFLNEYPSIEKSIDKQLKAL